VFVFPNQQKVWATSSWATFLNGQTSNPAGKIERGQLVGPMEMESNVEIVKRVVYKRNPTKVGQSIFEKCKSSSKKIHFIGWRMSGVGDTGTALPGFSSFDSDSPTVNEATIYVNLDLCIRVLDPNNPNPNKILNGYIILLHEMGHATHWLRYGSARFETMVAKNETRSQRLMAAEYEVGSSQLGKDIYNRRGIGMRDKRRLIDEAVRTKVGHADFYGKQFPNDIELANWLEHEGPICDAWGIARRPGYTAIANAF